MTNEIVSVYGNEIGEILQSKTNESGQTTLTVRFYDKLNMSKITLKKSRMNNLIEFLTKEKI